MKTFGIGRVGVVIAVGLPLVACEEQELGFTADDGPSATMTGTATSGSAVNTASSATANATSVGSSGADGGTGGTGSDSSEATGAGGSPPEEPECILEQGRHLFAGYFSSCIVWGEDDPQCFGQDDWEAPGTTAPVVDIAINQDGACALQTDCTLKCWGGTNMLANSPPSGEFTALATAEFGVFCALDRDHHVQCWGPDAWLADPPSQKLFAISGGEMGQFCGLTATKDAICWGPPDLPAVSTDGPFTALAAADHVCALGVDGSLQCWGNETYGATEPPAGTFSSLVSNHVHSCALSEAGEASCWGGLYFEDESPELIDPPSETFTKIVSGTAHMCGLTPSGDAVCWGYGTPERENGTLPDLSQASPTSAGFVEIAAGYWHTCGLDATGLLECWGDITAP